MKAREKSAIGITLLMILGLVSMATYLPLELDTTTNSAKTVDYAHNEIHSGSHFYYQGYRDVASGDSLQFLITTPNTTEWGHLLMDGSCEGECEIVLYEAATASGGTAITIYNNNRNSAHSATITWAVDPTVASLGTSIGSNRIGSGRFEGGVARNDNEIVLKQDTKYILKVNNEAGAANLVNLNAGWYEHTNN